MIVTSPTDLFAFVDWLRATDAHAAHHIRLIESADRVLRQPAAESMSDRTVLADRLERWRYQHFQEHAADWSEQNEALVDALDLAANELAGREPRPPRRARQAIFDHEQDGASLCAGLAALDPQVRLDEVTRRAAELTQAWFAAPGDMAGTRRRMRLYAPLYVSSQCVNYCLYCGFRYPLDIVRKHLTVAETVQQARLLQARGFRNLLLVGGEFPSQTTTGYYAELVRALVGEGISPAIEIAPQSTAGYAELAAAGACGLTLYQETYDPRLYAQYHVRGPKAAFHWRLESHERAAEAGIGRLGLGILLGLADPRADLAAMLRHGTYLHDRFPDCLLAFSLPRIHEAPTDFHIPHPVADDDLVRLYCALRIAFPAAELVLSTREPAELRDRLARICITQMSAGSSTVPGGYQSNDPTVGGQFPVADHRAPADVAQWLEEHGFEVTWSLDGPVATPRANVAPQLPR